MSSFSIIILLLLINSFINAEKVCPIHGYMFEPENCISTCLPTNDQCLSNEKCCYRLTEPCGYHCIEPKDDVEKSGQCPGLQANNTDWYLCDVFKCSVDNDCQGTEKCCSNICGSKICITPQ